MKKDEVRRQRQRIKMNIKETDMWQNKNEGGGWENIRNEVERKEMTKTERKNAKEKKRGKKNKKIF